MKIRTEYSFIILALSCFILVVLKRREEKIFLENFSVKLTYMGIK